MTDQMDWVHRCMIVTADNSELARYVAGKFGDSSQGMFSVALKPAGTTPTAPTHFISSGLIDRKFADMLVSPQALIDGAALLDVVVPLELATKLINTSDISEEPGLAACARLGLDPYDWGVLDELVDAAGDELGDANGDQLGEG